MDSIDHSKDTVIADSDGFIVALVAAGILLLYSIALIGIFIHSLLASVSTILHKCLFSV